MPKRARAQLGFEIYAADRTKQGIASVHRGFSGLASGVSREAGIASQAVGGAIMGNATFAAAAAGAAMIGFAASATSAFIDVERRWAEVTTLMPQATRRATDEMLGDVRAFSREAGFAIQDSISASYQALSAGIEQGSLTEFLEVSGQAARAGVTDITTSVDAITSALNAYNLAAEHGTDVSDAMFTAIRLGKTTFAELGPVMGPVLPIAASLNTEFTEITASVAALTAQGNPTAIAMTQIRSALVALSKDTEARSIFESVMGMTFAEYQEQGGTLVGALQVVVDEAERSGQSVIDVFGRVEAANAALALTSEKGAETFTKAMNDTAGATEQAAARIEETAATKAEKIGAVFDDFRLGIGGFFTNVAFGIAGALRLMDTGIGDTKTKVTTTLGELDAAITAFESRHGLGADGGGYVPRGDLSTYPLYAIPPTEEERLRSAVAATEGLTRQEIWDTLSFDRQQRLIEQNMGAYQGRAQPWDWSGIRGQLDETIRTRQTEARTRLDTLLTAANAARTAELRSAYGAAFGASASAQGERARAAEIARLIEGDPLIGGGAGFNYDITSPEGSRLNEELRRLLEVITEGGGATRDNTAAIDRNTEMLEATSERLIEVVYNPDIGPPGLLTSTDPRHFTRLNAANRGRHLLTRIP